jgi:predicted DNA-binding transcriptional regulator AlpA
MVMQADQSTESRTLRSPEAAQYIGMSDSWLRQTRMFGRSDGPPFRRMGARTVRYLRSELDQWLERRCSATGSAQPNPEPEASALRRSQVPRRVQKGRHRAAR